MNMEKYIVSGREATLYLTDNPNRPLIVLNNYSGNGNSVIEALKDYGYADFNLLCIGNLKWDHDMIPWYCPPLSPQDTPCTGVADEYLALLLSEIIPQAKNKLKGVPIHIGIAGYSLAGLFAIYAMYRYINNLRGR